MATIGFPLGCACTTPGSNAATIPINRRRDSMSDPPPRESLILDSKRYSGGFGFAKLLVESDENKSTGRRLLKQCHRSFL
jgi:hypothetical protein